MANTKYTISLIDRVTKTATKIGASLNTVGVAAKRADAAISSMSILIGGAAVAGVFKLGAELESTKLKFNTLTGSVEKGTKLFGELTEFANATPFSNQALNKNATTLLAFGETAESVTKTLRILGDISAGDEQKLGSLTLAFAQMKSAGKLMGQDLLQMINAGFNPLQTISEQTGKSMAYLKDQMSKGAISSKMVANAFEAATAKGGRFHGLTKAMAGTMAGKWSTVMGKAKFLIAEIGISFKDQFVPALDSAIAAIDRMAKWIKNNNQKFKNIIKTIGTFVTVMGSAVIAIKLVSAAMAVNPIGLIVVAIGVLITAVIRAWDKFEGFRKVVLGTWEAMKELATMVKEFATSLKENLINRIKQVFEGIKGLGSAFKALFKGQFKEAGEIAKKAIDDIYNISGKIEKAKKAGKRIGDAYREGAAKGIRTDAISTPSLDMGAAGGDMGLSGAIGLSSEAAKLKAEGIVSGGIKTFNINIQQITGIDKLETTNIEETPGKVGDAVIMAITEALADIKNI